MSIQKRLASFRYAFRGLADLFKSQPNARIHLAATVVAVAAGFFFGVSLAEWAMLVLCIAMVLSLEAANTALEHLTDLVSPDFHPLAGRAKDVAAAAVLIAAIGAVLVGCFIFFPKVWAVLER
jgi:diacylglycerol kinase